MTPASYHREEQDRFNRCQNFIKVVILVIAVMVLMILTNV